MKANALVESNVSTTIAGLVRQFDVSWGQAQKTLNVILKYHQLLFHPRNRRLKRALHCPLDSVILEKIGARKSLRQIEKAEYEVFQQRILTEAKKLKLDSKVSFDKHWDEQNLRDQGLL